MIKPPDYIELSKDFTPVQIESPLNAPTQAGIERNQLYGRIAAVDCLRRHESPYASHIMLAHPDMLNDLNEEERTLGISAGFRFIPQTKKSVVYADLGISRGMKAGIEYAKSLGHSVEYRHIPHQWSERTYKIINHKMVKWQLLRFLANLAGGFAVGFPAILNLLYGRPSVAPFVGLSGFIGLVWLTRFMTRKIEQKLVNFYLPLL